MGAFSFPFPLVLEINVKGLLSEHTHQPLRENKATRMHQGTLCKEKHSWKSLINFPHISHIPPSSWDRLTGEELSDYIGGGAHLKKLLSNCPSQNYTNSLSMLVPTKTRLQNNSNRSKLVLVMFLPFMTY